MSLAARMAEVMAATTRVEKRGRNKFFNYAYATVDDVSEAIRGELGKAGIGLFVQVENHEQFEVPGNKGARIKTVVYMRFTLVDPDDKDDRQECLWRGESLDDSDKGLNKAITAARKTWLICTFLVPTGEGADDPDMDATPPARPPAPSLDESLRDQGDPVTLPTALSETSLDLNEVWAAVKSRVEYTGLTALLKDMNRKPADFRSSKEAVDAMLDFAQVHGKIKF